MRSDRQQPLVSIVIPCFDQVAYVAEAIDSALGQTYGNVEVVAVDDGSTDGSGEIIDSYPTVVGLHQRNSGLSAARNAGLGAASGAFVVFLDADDRLLPNAISAGMERMGERSDLAFVIGRAILEADGAAGGPTTPREIDGVVTYADLLRGTTATTPGCVLFRRSALEAVGGFDRAFPAAEDYEIYLRLVRRHPAVSHGEIVAVYRRHGAGMSRTPHSCSVRCSGPMEPSGRTSPATRLCGRPTATGDATGRRTTAAAASGPRAVRRGRAT